MAILTDIEFFAKLTGILNDGWIEIPDEQGFQGSGGPGLLLEKLIGIDTNNRDGPDTGKWELKYHGGNSPLTLFHLTALPKGIMQQVVRTYGWPDKQGRTSFRHTIWGQSQLKQTRCAHFPIGFKVASEVVNEKKCLVVKTEGTSLEIPIEEPFWTHDSLINAFVYKLRRLALVKGRKRNGRVFFESAQLYSELNNGKFIQAIEEGVVAIDFDARTNLIGDGLRDHGTKFRIKVRDLGKLYSNIQEFNSGELPLKNKFVKP